MPVGTSMTYLPPGSPDIRRALNAGFSPDEVRYMFALDLPTIAEVELDGTPSAIRRAADGSSEADTTIGPRQRHGSA